MDSNKITCPTTIDPKVHFDLARNIPVFLHVRFLNVSPLSKAKALYC